MVRSHGPRTVSPSPSGNTPRWMPLDKVLSLAVILATQKPQQERESLNSGGQCDTVRYSDIDYD
ncbi:hypothetical protein E2C01_094420 [Portunus trituberculatus]|uniref:Uncharacterized protein n=1 Tax=Portunus trituberculatus TaxID=210409 RepID=A0A5B7JXJ3_PORTR|nr:hypothetical protein [Portunus trituberculatus]